MKTKLERTYVEASIIGDSHAMSIWKHLAPAVIFRHTMTAPAKHFDGQFFGVEDGQLYISSKHLSEAFPRAEEDVIQVMAKARERLDAQLQAIINAGLPVVSSLGSASYRFARKVASKDPNSGELFSNKILRAAAGEHIENFVAFHKELLAHVPTITFMLGACRYPESQKSAWLAYDDAISTRMTEAGIAVIDSREATGNEELKLLPEFEAADILHGNDRWCQIVADRIFQIVGVPIRPATEETTAGDA
jgi:hypothetical protein